GQGLDTLRAAIAEIATAEDLSNGGRPLPEEDRLAAPTDDRKVPELGH
ncbi:MAG TPA: GTPase HflX, partial [Paraburkholderia sp.]|nr:GTPase HflX [Paraburkholderia sp.]